MPSEENGQIATHLEVLRRAFENGNDTVHIDGWTTRRGQEALAYAHKMDWVIMFATQGSQYTAYNYTVTDLGREQIYKARPNLSKDTETLREVRDAK